MQTIPKFSIRPNGDSHTVLWSGQVVGKIDFNITAQRWEYSRYSQYPAIQSGATPEECIAQAKEDHAAAHTPEPTVTVVHVHHVTTQPTYIAQGWGNWKQHGPGNSTKVTVRNSRGEFDLWIPATFARQLRPGMSCIHHQDSVTHQDYLRWSKRPVRRQSAIAA